MVEVACGICGKVHDAHAACVGVDPEDVMDHADANDVDVDEMVEELLEQERLKEQNRKEGVHSGTYSIAPDPDESATEPPSFGAKSSWEKMDPETVSLTFDPEGGTVDLEGAAPPHTHAHPMTRSVFTGSGSMGKSQRKSGAALAQNLTERIESASERLKQQQDDPEEVGSCPMCGATVTDDNDARVESSAGGVYCDVECYNDLVGP